LELLNLGVVVERLRVYAYDAFRRADVGVVDLPALAGLALEPRAELLYQRLVFSHLINKQESINAHCNQRHREENIENEGNDFG
jgi:hypothetical protein